MNARKILFPTDFSSSAQSALELAMSLARERRATLLVVHVEEASTVYGEGDFMSTMEALPRGELEVLLKQAVPANNDVPCEYVLLVGAPADEIAAIAQRENVEMIVMATHGRRGLSRLLMGSVAEQVMRSATCPVVTVKAKEVGVPVTA